MVYDSINASGSVGNGGPAVSVVELRKRDFQCLPISIDAKIQNIVAVSIGIISGIQNSDHFCGPVIIRLPGKGSVEADIRKAQRAGTGVLTDDRMLVSDIYGKTEEFKDFMVYFGQ